MILSPGEFASGRCRHLLHGDLFLMLSRGSLTYSAGGCLGRQKALLLLVLLCIPLIGLLAYMITTGVDCPAQRAERGSSRRHRVRQASQTWPHRAAPPANRQAKDLLDRRRITRQSARPQGHCTGLIFDATGRRHGGPPWFPRQLRRKRWSASQFASAVSTSLPTISIWVTRACSAAGRGHVEASWTARPLSIVWATALTLLPDVHAVAYRLF